MSILVPEAQPTERKLRPCASCGTLTENWWCSTQCRRDEDGDERYDDERYESYFEDDDDERGDDDDDE